MMGARAASPSRRLVAVLVAQTATAPASAGRRPHFTVAANSHGGHRLAPIDTRNVPLRRPKVVGSNPAWRMQLQRGFDGGNKGPKNSTKW